MTYMLESDWVTTTDIVSKAAQTIALAVAGWWTYSLFVKQRHDRRRASVTHRLLELAIEGEQAVVRVEVVVQNIGNVVLAPPEGHSKVVPSPPGTCGSNRSAQYDGHNGRSQGRAGGLRTSVEADSEDVFPSRRKQHGSRAGRK